MYLFFGKLLAATLCSVLFVTSCGDDDLPTSSFDGAIVASVENQTDYAAAGVTKAVALIEGMLNDVEVNGTASNTGFTMNLPSTLERGLLQPINILGAKVSRNNVRWAEIWEIDALKDTDLIGAFVYENEDGDTSFRCFFAYAERKVTITGVDDDDCTWNVSLKQGWNRVFLITTGSSQEMTTKDPGNLKWYFLD